MFMKSQLMRMYKSAPRETAHILRQTEEWKALSRHYDAKKRTFDEAGIQDDPESSEALSSFAQSLQRTRGVEAARDTADALRKSPFWVLSEMLKEAATIKQFRAMAKERFADMPGYAGNPAALLSLGGLHWKTKFPQQAKEEATPQGKPRGARKRAETQQQMKEEIAGIRNMIRNLIRSSTGIDEETMLSLAKFIRGEEATQGETMPQFFETRMGRTFYEGHLPRLVAALESIAKSLTEISSRLTPPPAPEKPQDRDKEK